jgi:hypothetical protein
MRKWTLYEEIRRKMFIRKQQCLTMCWNTAIEEKICLFLVSDVSKYKQKFFTKQQKGFCSFLLLLYCFPCEYVPILAIFSLDPFPFICYFSFFSDTLTEAFFLVLTISTITFWLVFSNEEYPDTHCTSYLVLLFFFFPLHLFFVRPATLSYFSRLFHLILCIFTSENKSIFCHVNFRNYFSLISQKSYFFYMSMSFCILFLLCFSRLFVPLMSSIFCLSLLLQR